MSLFGLQSEACFEVHDIIAQYILDEMPYKFCKMIHFDSIFMGDHFSFDINQENAGRKYLLSIDEYFLPSVINYLAIGTRALHMGFMQDINELIEAHPKLLETNTMMKLFKDEQSLPMKKVYEGIKDNCKAIQSLLANNRHDEAIAWISNFLNTHPYVTTYNKAIDFYHNLRKECSHDPEIVVRIDEDYPIADDFKAIIIDAIVKRARVVFMMSSGISNDEIVEYVKSE